MPPPKQFLTSSAGRLLSFRALGIPISALRHLGNSFSPVRKIDGDYILQDFSEDGVSYLSKEDFDTLATGEEEATIGVNLHVQSVPSDKNILYSYLRAQILDFMLILISIS